ncbi:hypothetical protein LRP30_40725 [Bradyrhizobium sp. C-145]|uniref:hypothetical protein n=1 Tax=Bradyrhizobium sp. C-145 TaxID=574727 RepID=UPI00201B6C38|nr:hypothetical protein [Bradyrhizobium sp. C-145]UQR62994.1 hypothetical protein LRP30_40725 [Bradyrhizobium sp. C-145]
MQSYTFILPENDIETDDVVVASGLSRVEMAELVRKRNGAGVVWSEFEHEGFRCFEMVQLATHSGSHRRTVLERDRALAMRLIDIQTIGRHGELCAGMVLTDRAARDAPNVRTRTGLLGLECVLPSRAHSTICQCLG